jgi:hypothetical protein
VAHDVEATAPAETQSFVVPEHPETADGSNAAAGPEMAGALHPSHVTLNGTLKAHDDRTRA